MLEVRAGNGQIILLGRDINEIRYLEQHVLIAIVASCLLTIPAVLLIGIALSFRPLRRLGEFQVFARKVAAGQFNLRMPYAGRGDELDQISVTVNTMIENIGRIVEQVKTVTDAIAHDLRTPLTRVRTRLDDIRSRALTGEEQADTIGEIIDDLNIVLERFAALLRISELEASERRSGFETIALAPLLHNIVELYQPLAEDADIQLGIREIGPVQVFADRNLLFEALSNLVDNAIKFARKNVAISVSKDTSATVIKVQDDGPGIPTEEREAVLRRFYRRPGKTSRPGNGLGLSVVTAILRLHRFELELADAGPGLAAKILIPAGREKV
jgi:signal transduction histidine kinase